MLGEMPLPVVDEDRVRPFRREQNEIEVTVAVDVSEGDAGRVAVAGADSGALGDVLKVPVAKILIERAASLGAAEENVHQPVAVHVAERDAGALSEDPVAEQRAVAHEVLEVDPRFLRRHPCESRRAAAHAQLAPAVAGLLMPFGRLRLTGTSGGDQREE
jgi:hypothetical protein